MLFLIAAQTFGQPPSLALFDIAAAMEMLHHFALIHDDIVDRSPTRRNAPSMHVRCETLLAPSHRTKLTGSDLAMIAADWLFAHALDIVADADCAPPVKFTVLRRILTASKHTAVAQIDEMRALAGRTPLPTADVRRAHAGKTVYYSFTCPLLAGASFNPICGDIEQTLGRIGEHFGMAYQIQDDLDDFQPGAPRNLFPDATLPMIVRRHVPNGDEEPIEQALRRCRKIMMTSLRHGHRELRHLATLGVETTRLHRFLLSRFRHPNVLSGQYDKSAALTGQDADNAGRQWSLPV